jgi:tetratricopeptide (TPR) repeat protein
LTATPSTDLEQQLNQALQLHREGQLVLAEVLYRQVLQARPRHAQALGMLGLIEAGKKNLDGAVDLLRRSIEANLQSAPMHFNLGLVYQEQRLGEQALQCFERALALSPAAPQVHNARGVALKNLGRYEEALASYEQAIEQLPGYFDALHNRGVVLRYLGRHEDAVASFTLALQLRPGSAEAHNNLGYTLHQLGRDEEALAACVRAVELDPQDHDAWNTRGMALHALDRFDPAIESFQRALRIDPDSAEAAMNMGVSLYELRRFEDAHASFERALQLQPGSSDARVNLGNALMELDRPEEALACYRQVVEMRPGDQDVLMNIGNVLRDMHRYPEALAYYERALALDDGCADVHWNMALCLLVMGEWERGWHEYEWRRRIPSLFDTARQLDAPLWNGSESLEGKTILVYAEQGLGDTIQVCRYAHELAARGARVVLEVQRPLLGLLVGLGGVAQLIARGDPLPPHDFQCPLLSLPLAFATRIENVPARVPYLFADPALVEKWRPVVEGKPGLNVGLAWSGNAAYRNDHRRSIALDVLLAALPEGVNCWSLQKDVSAQDQRALEAHGRAGRFELNDFVHTAAQIALMDAVISVDTSLAHLAAALSQPTLVLLAHTADWRWLWPRTDSPWYPSVTLFRQASRGNWRPVLEGVAARIDELAHASRER